MLKTYHNGVLDLKKAFFHYSQWVFLGLQDIRMRYRRSLIGPWWVTLSNFIMIGVLGFLWSNLLEKPLTEFLPFFAIGYTFWQWISAIIFEATQGFIPFKPIMTQVNLPLSSYILRVNFRQLIILLHNLVVIIFILTYSENQIGVLNLFWAILGMVVLMVNLFLVSIIIQIFCTRYQDMAKVFETFIQVAFFFTPILWDPSLLKKYQFMIDFNVFYHWIELVRAPLLNASFDYIHLKVSIITMLLLFFLSMKVLGTYKNKITFWI